MIAAARLLVVMVLSVTPAACGGTAASEDRTVVVTIRHSRFAPSVVDVPAGTRVRFVVRNVDPIAHELIVGDQAVQDLHANGTEAHHGEKPGEVSVAPGATAETTYRFTTAGRLLFGCHLPGHWAYGMRGTITIGP